jgi:hypothetical protein
VRIGDETCATGSGADDLFAGLWRRWLRSWHTYCNFGASVALSADGNTLAVGSPQESGQSTGINQHQDGTKNDLYLNSGAVYVFVRENGSWHQEAYVKASNTHAQDNFGTSVGLSSAPSAGAVDAFVHAGSTWTWVEYVKASNAYAGTLFGYSVAASADALTVAVGSRWELGSSEGINGSQSNGSSAYGAAYVLH